MDAHQRAHHPFARRGYSWSQSTFFFFFEAEEAASHLRFLSHGWPSAQALAAHTGI